MINFFFEDYSTFEVENKYLSEWLTDTIRIFNGVCGDINIIFCSDDYLLNINKQYLNHDYYTDIVTFNYNEDNIISGDFFISIDRVKDNAKLLGENFNSEFLRIIIHGLLHLLGFNDKSEDEKTVMREQENLFIEKYKDYVR